MATIEELERKIQQLEKDILADKLKEQELIEKSEKAIDFALHAYKVDHYGFIWVWDVNQQGYRKTNMRIMTPEICDGAVTTDKLAPGCVTSEKIPDGAVTSDKIGDGEVKGRNIGENEIQGRHIADKAVGSEQIANEAILNRHIGRYEMTVDKFAPGVIDESQILLSDVVIEFDDETGDIFAHFINNGDVKDANMNDNTGDVYLVIEE